jgi:hypothetical protein
MPHWKRQTDKSGTYATYPVGRVDLVGNHALGLYLRGPIIPKATAYSVKRPESGTIFTTRGASGAVTFTLPALAGSYGCYYRFINVVDQSMTIATAAATSYIVGINNATTGVNVAFSTGGEKIGAVVDVYSIGTKWIAVNCCKNTMTVGT